jgi:hypothetical protein
MHQLSGDAHRPSISQHRPLLHEPFLSRRRSDVILSLPYLHPQSHSNRFERVAVAPLTPPDHPPPTYGDLDSSIRMSRSREPTNDDAADRVIVKIDGLEELSAIREALDGIRQNIDWWMSNHHRDQWLPVKSITSMPIDPLATDWAERLNTFTSDDLPKNSSSKQRTPLSAPQHGANATDGIDDEARFCCEAPDLQWTGDPDFPGIACANCGYTAVDCGSVVMSPAPADPGSHASPVPSRSPQQELF